MIWQLIFVSMLVLNTLGEDNGNLPSAEDYLSGIQQLIPTFNVINVFDGPSSISSAKITSSIKVMQPSVEQMMYYNYYTSAVNCAFIMKNLNCFYCERIKGDIKDYICNNFNNCIYKHQLILVFSFRQCNIWHKCSCSTIRKT